VTTINPVRLLADKHRQLRNIRGDPSKGRQRRASASSGMICFGLFDFSAMDSEFIASVCSLSAQSFPNPDKATRIA
jgi:hypothetical protein